MALAHAIMTALLEDDLPGYDSATRLRSAAKGWYIFVGHWSLSPVNRHPGTGQDSKGRRKQDARRPEGRRNDR